MNKPRSIILFEQAIRTERTSKKYHEMLNAFLKWIDKDSESLLSLSSDHLQVSLEDYIFHLKKRLKRTSIELHLAAINKFLVANDKEYKRHKLRMFLPEKVKASGEKAWTTHDIQKMLEYADNKRTKALIHFLSATGCRVGVIEELKWKHITPISDGCYIITAYPGSTHEYTTFLHQEARKALDEYTEERRKSGDLVSDESYVFSNKLRELRQKPKPMSINAANCLISRVIIKAGAKRVKLENSIRYDTATDMGFRKRFNTILKSNPNISYAMAERMMDHRIYLEPIYFDTTNKEKLFEEYKKAIPELIIDDSERIQVKVQKLEAEKNTMERKLPLLINEALERVKLDLLNEGWRPVSKL